MSSFEKTTAPTEMETAALVQPQYRLTGELTFAQKQIPTSKLPRRLLAMLMITCKDGVRLSTLVDELWPETPPKTAKGTVQTYIFKLRKALDPQRRLIIAMPGQGYRLAIRPDEVDVLSFIEAAKDLTIRADDDEQKLRRTVEGLQACLGLLRGPVLQDVSPGPHLERFTALFNEWRFTAVLRYVKAKVMLGEHGDVEPLLLSLMHESELNEEVVMWRMLALYRSGQPQQALDTFYRLQKRLREGLGIDPDPRLTRLLQMILQRNTCLQDDVSYLF